jgi:hypothetical protein
MIPERFKLDHDFQLVEIVVGHWYQCKKCRSHVSISKFPDGSIEWEIFYTPEIEAIRPITCMEAIIKDIIE